MPVVRHALIVIAAVFGLLTTIAWAGAAAACPPEPVVQPMHHDDGCGQGLPTDHSVQLCAVCLAVLPAPAAAEVHAALPFNPVAIQLESLSGIDPALDPPPPRAA